MDNQQISTLLDGSHPETHENANMDHTFASSFFRIAGENIKKYCLDRVYAGAAADAHRSGSIHIHDLDMGVVGYCAGWSMQDLLDKGMSGVRGQTSSGVPKHFSTALGQLVNITGTLQNEWAGAMAWNSVDTMLAPYIARDGLNYTQVRQAIQETVFASNAGSRWGGQPPFINWSLDLTAPSDLAVTGVVGNGHVYADFQDEMDLFNLAFLDVMSEGDSEGKVFTFPIPTYNLTKDFDWGSPVTDRLMEVTAKYGVPYFQNFINSDLESTEVRAMCCRLRLDMREMYNRVGGTFGYGDKTGSVGVVTVNLPQAAYKSKNEREFLGHIDNAMFIAKDALETKRHLVNANMKAGLMPWTSSVLRGLDFHFSTIGLVGMNEACMMLLGEPISTPSGLDLAERTLAYMSGVLKEFQKQTGHIYNLEETPAEGSGWKLARDDVKRCPGIVTAGELAPFYTNSTHLPVNSAMDILDQLMHQDKLQSHYTGGTVFHVFLGESSPYPKGIGKLVRRIAERTSVKNFTITPTFSVCKVHGRMSGEWKTCPECLRKCEVYSRVVGYFRPVDQWNPGRREEFRMRATFKSSL